MSAKKSIALSGLRIDKNAITVKSAVEIERQFNLKIEKIKANKGVYYLKTDKGERCLKKINY